MTAEQRAKIDSEVLRCLEECRAVDHPPARIADFIDRLKADPQWTDEEVIELQTRVITAMLYRPGPVAAAVEPPLWTALRRLSVFGVLLLTVIALVLLAIYIGGNLALRSEFRGLQKIRDDARKALESPPPRLPRPQPSPAPAPPAP